MTSSSTLAGFAARLRGLIGRSSGSAAVREQEANEDAFQFQHLALELFALQFAGNSPYRRLCEARNVTAENVSDWHRIPAVPTSAFKELEMSCLPAAERTRVFHSSGTTGQRPSRHFHNAGSLAVYEASLLPWFERHLLHGGPGHQPAALKFVVLTPPPQETPRSSLVHMFGTAGREFAPHETVFSGTSADDGAWGLDFQKTLAGLDHAVRENAPVLLLGTAFSFVHLADHLVATGRRFELPSGSRVLETGGYKGRSRTLARTELHSLITGHLGVPGEAIVSEYGMSELSSQAYDGVAFGELTGSGERCFRFPPWARAHIISPETGREVAEGETGLLRIFDLANVWSVMAVQTEDMAVRRGRGFELIGRAAKAEPRGCSLMPA